MKAYSDRLARYFLIFSVFFILPALTGGLIIGLFIEPGPGKLFIAMGVILFGVILYLSIKTVGFKLLDYIEIEPSQIILKIGVGPFSKVFRFNPIDVNIHYDIPGNIEQIKFQISDKEKSVSVVPFVVQYDKGDDLTVEEIKEYDLKDNGYNYVPLVFNIKNKLGLLKK